MKSRTFNILFTLFWVVAILGAIGIVASVAAAENNGTWRLPPAECYPNFDDYDYRYQVGEGPDAIVWWCDEPEGLQFNWRTGNYGEANQSKILLALKGLRDLWALDQATFHRPSTPEEMTVVYELQRMYAPRCYPDSSYQNAAVYTATSQNKLGPRRIGSDRKQMAIPSSAIVACGWRLDEPQRYCIASNLKASNGEIIPLDSWVSCRIERAPADGWPE